MREMKESGIEWIGSIPEDWEVKPNKLLMHKQKKICEIYKDEDILSLSMRGVIVRDLDAGGKIPKTFDGYQYVEPQNLLMCLFDMDVTPRCIGLIKNHGVTSPAYSQFVMNEGVDARYYCYYFTMLDDDKILVHLAKNLRHSLTEDDLGVVKMAYPPLAEQKRIADYLDVKCEEIVGTIRDIEKEIETLEQYKRSLITEVVTGKRGIRGEGLGIRKMKESGIEWIGQIPEDWEVKKGKYILKYLSKPMREGDEVITCFRDGEVTLRKNRREDGFTIAEKECGYQGIDIGDLVVHGMDGFAGSIGISDSRGKASPVLNVLDTKENKRYVMYYLRSMAYGSVFTALATGIRVRSCDLRWNKLAELIYPVPSRDEQDAIVVFLETKLKVVDETIVEKRKQIEILEVYKKSLVFEYVTGKKEVVRW